MLLCVVDAEEATAIADRRHEGLSSGIAGGWGGRADGPDLLLIYAHQRRKLRLLDTAGERRRLHDKGRYMDMGGNFRGRWSALSGERNAGRAGPSVRRLACNGDVTCRSLRGKVRDRDRLLAHCVLGGRDRRFTTRSPATSDKPAASRDPSAPNPLFRGRAGLEHKLHLLEFR